MSLSTQESSVSILGLAFDQRTSDPGRRGGSESRHSPMGAHQGDIRCAVCRPSFQPEEYVTKTRLDWSELHTDRTVYWRIRKQLATGTASS